MNRKGFTMIELLAAMVILSLLTMISVPTVLNVLNNNRKSTIISDSRKLLSNGEYLVNSNNNNIKRPRKDGECIVITLNYLDLPDEFDKGPHGYAYDKDKSYVIVKRQIVKNEDNSINLSKRYKYYVTLVEKGKHDDYYGITNAFEDDLKDKSYKNKVSYVDEGNIYIGTGNIKSDTGSAICSSSVGIKYYGLEEKNKLTE